MIASGHRGRADHRRHRRHTPSVVFAVHGLALAVGGAAAVWTAARGVADPAAAAAFGALVVVGEAYRIPEPEGREAAPVAFAGALAYALLAAETVAVVVAVSAAAAVVGQLRGAPCDAAARRVLTVAFAAASAQPLHGGSHPAYALLLLAGTILCDAVLAAVLGAARAGHPFASVLRDELAVLPGVGSAVCAGGVVLAQAEQAAGLWALPVCGAPLLLTQTAFRRHAAIRATHRETITSLARATELAGYTPVGHARRVSALSHAMGRELGLGGKALAALEHAALMHDIGQLSLVDPVPGGATSSLDQVDRRRIALLGAEVVRRTGAPEEVARIVEGQADPYREQPLAGRIVRTANAYEDMAAGGTAASRGLQALERLRLDTAHEYDPRVVEALTRVVARAGQVTHR
ncbi:HD domain-containing protein [Streptomyces sp. ME03-5709C]|nr:HD domain-containing protein [Streptomyces sp. ME03-5709C]